MQPDRKPRSGVVDLSLIDEMLEVAADLIAEVREVLARLEVR